MTRPEAEQTEPQEEPDLPAALRLSVAVDQLVQPGLTRLDRDQQAAAAALAQLDGDHLHHIRTLRQRHAQRPRADHAGRRRLIGQMTAAGHRHRRDRHRLAAGLPTDTAPTLSLIEQLLAAVHGTGGSNGAPGAGVHRSPIGLAAAHVLWATGTTLDPYIGIGTRLGCHDGARLAEYLLAWAAEPVHADQDARLAEQWVSAAREVLTPPRRFVLTWPCPWCHTERTWTRNEDGKPVQQAALQVDYVTGVIRCTAPSCTAHWPPHLHDHFLRMVTHNAEKAG